MHIVGTDQITVRDGHTAPAGQRHAIDVNGRVLCRSARARFTWPAVSWSDTEEQACPLCVQVRRTQQVFTAPAHEAYPQAPVYSPALASSHVPAQPAVADPLFAEPVFAEAALDEPAFDDPGFDEPAFDEAGFAGSMFAEPTDSVA